MRRISVVAVLLFVLFSCCVSRAQSGASIVVTAAESGRVVNLKPGDTFEVRLEANPSTGYGWTVSRRKEQYRAAKEHEVHPRRSWRHRRCRRQERLEV